MRLYWRMVFRSWQYRKADRNGRRMIELRYALARALRAERKRRRITQKNLARMMNVAPSTISYIECMSPKVRIDVAVRAFFIIGMDDEAIAAAFNLSTNVEIQQLRRRASGRFYK